MIDESVRATRTGVDGMHAWFLSPCSKEGERTSWLDRLWKDLWR